MHARSSGWTIIHVQTKADGGLRPRRPLKGLRPLPDEPVLYRTGASAFSNQNFDHIPSEQDKGEIVILSLSLSSACLSTALYAHELCVPVVLVEDALSGGDRDRPGLEAIETVARSIVAPFVKVVRADDLIGPSRGLRLVRG
jgi:nicotinamidase-related amidase